MRNNLDPIPDGLLEDYLSYIDQYRTASSLLASSGTLFPNQQVRGLLLELSLKTYLLICGNTRKGHNLKELADDAVKEGLRLDPQDLLNIINPINNIYYEGGPWDHRYLSRYPMERKAALVVSIPTHKMVDDLINRIVLQISELQKS